MIRSYPLNIEVTVNDDGFDKPISARCQKHPNSPFNFDISWPNPYDKMSRRLHFNDVVKVYAGFGDLSDVPVFTGCPFRRTGRSISKIYFNSFMNLLGGHTVFINDEFNLDGLEIAEAIRFLFSEVVDYSMFYEQFTTSLRGTDPKRYVNGLRHASGINGLKLLEELRGLTSSLTDLPNLPVKYILYESDLTLYMRKPQPTDGTGYPAYHYINIDDIAGEPDVSRAKTNRSVVTGKAYKDSFGIERKLSATHDDASSQQLNSVWDDVESTGLTSFSDCQDLAALLVEQGKFKQVKTQIEDLNLLEAIPGLTLIRVDESKYGFEGDFLAQDIDISLGGGNNFVRANLNGERTLVGDVI